MAEEVRAMDVDNKVLKFDQPIYMVVRGVANAGNIRLTDKGLAFKRKDTGAVETVHKSDMDVARWMRVGRGYELRITQRNGSFARFDGFRKSDGETLLPFLKEAYNLVVDEAVPSVKGWNWGEAIFENSSMTFTVNDGGVLFEVPLGALSNINSQKHEAYLEFHTVEGGAPDEQAIESMRFLIMPDETEEDATGSYDNAERFVENVKKHAHFTQETGEQICSFPELQCYIPRGRYAFELSNNYLRMHGKTYDHKLFYEHIVRLFLLPSPDERHTHIVLNCEPPLRQGSSRYPFIVLAFPIQEEITVKVNLDIGDARERIKSLKDKDDTDEITGSTWELVLQFLKDLTGRKVTGPESFKSHHGFKAVKTSHKANDGFLYPLEKAFLFIYKPPIFIKFDEIETIEFERVKRFDSSSKSFDLKIVTKGRGEFSFSSIGREEYDRLYEFIASKKLRISNIQGDQDVAQYDEFEGESGDEHDAYASRVRAEAAANGEDSEEDDESFHGSEMEDSGSSPSISGSEEDISDSELEPKKKKEVKKKKAKKSSDSESSGSEDEDEDKPKKKASKGDAKKKKDPNAPKKNQSSYMLWLADNREKIKEDNPGISNTDILKKAGELWKALSEDEKAPYEQQAQEEKASYAVKMKEYKANKGSDDEEEEDGGKAKKAAKKKDPNAPKKNQSSYMLWLADNRDKIKEDNPGISNTDILKKAGELWKALSEDEKAPYEQQAQEEKASYAVKMKEYKANKGSDDEEEEDGGKAKKAAKKKDPNAPKKNQSSYMLWLADNRDKIKEDNPGISNTDILKKAGELWKALTEDEKAPYEKQAQEEKASYAVKMKEYEANKGSDDEDEGTSSKKSKAPKDPNAPKKPQTAYMLWLADNRDSIKESNPGISVTEIAKKAGELWKDVPEDTKASYKAKQEELAQKYKEEMEKYIKEAGAAGAASSKAPAKKGAEGGKKKQTTLTAMMGKTFKSPETVPSDEDD